MGGAISAIFGGGYDEPDPVKYDPVPVRENEQEPVSASVRDAEQRKIRQRRAMSGTLLTSPLGVSGSGSSGSSGGSGLLGRSIQG